MGRLIFALVIAAMAVANLYEAAPSLAIFVGAVFGLAAIYVVCWGYRHSGTVERRIILIQVAAVIAVPVLFYLDLPWHAFGVLFGAFPALGLFVALVGLGTINGGRCRRW